MAEKKRIKRAHSRSKLGVVEVFAGLGCVAHGFGRSGAFEPIALTDIDKWAKRTHALNNAEIPYLRRDIEDLRPSQVLEKADGRKIVGLLGCPPCQGFSSAGKRSVNDRRNQLLRHYFRLASALEPRFLLMENVPRVLEYGLLDNLLGKLQERYRIWKGILNAANYGVPQTRQRAIVIAYHRDLGIEPTAPPTTHLGTRRLFDYSTRRYLSPSSETGSRLLGVYPDVERLGIKLAATAGGATKARTAGSLSNIVTVGEALGDLPPADGGDAPLSYVNDGSSYSQRLRSDGVQNHKPWAHRPKTVRRLARIPEGGDLSDLGKGSASDFNYFSQAYSRLHRNGIARTITTNFHNPGSGRFLHYTETRTLTIREAARLQGIADSFTFFGDLSVQERLVGNAFPVPLAQALAMHIASHLRKVL